MYEYIRIKKSLEQLYWLWYLAPRVVISWSTSERFRYREIDTNQEMSLYRNDQRTPAGNFGWNEELKHKQKNKRHLEKLKYATKQSETNYWKSLSAELNINPQEEANKMKTN